MHTYRGRPPASRFLLHVLLPADPLVALLVARGRPSGPLLGAAVMVADPAANRWSNLPGVWRHPLEHLRPVGLLPITLFGLFVCATAVPLSRFFRARARAGAGRVSAGPGAGRVEPLGGG
ncbi:hypothetical protein [Kitasatospora fiedleri]|uniref:hypothetical protein n=1 Tax=Kitasatospora fiedleri TaxID=2991545 RepID=UPI00249B9471|nr:hypothetical protein [Kitasatospora fiedleri]